MGYEKKYKEALERAKKLQKTCDSQAVVGWCEYIFPELCESEDEMMVKFIKKQLFNIKKTITENYELDAKLTKAIDWLEKQAEVESDDDIEAEEKDIRKALNKIWDEKRVEQKSEDKVEPKFKVEDWVVDNNGKVAIIYDLQKAGYVGHYTDGTDFVCKYSDEHLLHLWTIKDAKPGDVLASELSDSIILFKGIEDNNIQFYCDYDFSEIDVPGDRFSVNNSGQHYGSVEESEDFHPATKVQRDTLFAKMKEAEYAFDFEKKELKKIDNEKVNGEDYGIDSLYHAQRILEKTLGSVDGYQSDDGILEHRAAITAVKKLYEQKPTEIVKWSAQEEYCICELEAMVREAWRKAENVRNDVTIRKMQELMFFLKTLNPNKKSQRIVSAEAKETMYDSPAWSEEDESWFKELELMALSFSNDVSYLKKFFDWLKSLKQRIGWKPSDEQITVLELASKYERVFTPKQIDILIGLKEQLKKLKGE